MSSGVTLGSAPAPLYCLRDTSPVYVVRFLGGGLLASGNESGTVRVWSLASRRSAVDLRACETTSVLQVLGTPWGEGEAVVQCRSGVVGLWDLERARRVVQLETGAYGFCRCALAADGLLACPTESKERSVVLWDVRSGAAAQTVRDESAGGAGMPMHCEFARDGGVLAVCFEDGSLSAWDRRAGRWLVQGAALHRGEGGMLLRFAVDRRLRRGVGAGTHQLVVFDVAGESMTVAHAVEPPVRGFSDVAIRPDERLFGAAGWDHRVRLYAFKGAAAAPLAVLEHHTGVVHAIDFAADPIGTFATGADDHRIAVWSLYPRKSKS